MKKKRKLYKGNNIVVEEIWDDEVVEPVLTFDTHRRTSAGARESRNKFLTIAGRKVKSYDDMHELDREDVSERDFGNRLTCVPHLLYITILESSRRSFLPCLNICFFSQNSVAVALLIRLISQ